ELRLPTVAAAHLGGQRGRPYLEAAFIDIRSRAAPDRRVGGPRVVAEVHTGLVRAHGELRVSTDPYDERGHDVRHGVLLSVATRRHVEQPPPHPPESARYTRPGLKARGDEAQVRGQRHG